MGSLLRIVPVFAALAAASTSFAGSEPTSLAPGAPAPELSIKRWVKGTPVTKFEKNKTYVVEFWATWCGPCRATIPHLTELAKKNKDVTFLGVGIWEDDTEAIDKFVTEMGDKMGYNVAYSGNKEGMAATWMEPFSRNGIPSAFIVKDNRVLWAGHPMAMDKPLEEIKTGKFDLEAFKAEYEKEAAAVREQVATSRAISAATKAFDEGKRDEAKAALAKLVEGNSKLAATAESIKFGWLAVEDPAAWEAQAKALVASKEGPKVMRVASFAYSKSLKPETRDLARKAISIALEGTEGKDFDVQYYAFNVYQKTGDYKLALESVNKALELFPTSQMKDNADFKAGLDKSKAAIEAKLAAA